MDLEGGQTGRRQDCIDGCLEAVQGHRLNLNDSGSDPDSPFPFWFQAILYSNSLKEHNHFLHILNELANHR